MTQRPWELQHPPQNQEHQRRLARLAHIIEDWLRDDCYEHGEKCQDRPTCLAKEIIAREIAWS